MTASQMRGIARAFRTNRTSYEGEPEKQKIIDSLAIDVANELNALSGAFSRNNFLQLCGHADYQPKVS
jgi:hypothetical protein